MKNKIFFSCFISIWLILIVLNFIIKTPEFSEAENRYVAKLPKITMESLLNGEFSKQMDTYINDHFVFRDKWLNIRAAFERTLGKDEISNVYIGKEGYLFEKFTEENVDRDSISYKINKINEFKNKTDTNIYITLVPNSIYINRDKLPENATTFNQKDVIEDIYNKLEINKINVIDTLEKNKNNKLYFKLDHHMTSKGAYLVYEKITKDMLNKDTNENDYIKEKVTDSFYGTFYSKVNLKSLKPDDIYIYKNKNVKVTSAVYDNREKKSIYNFNYLKKKDKYSMFLDGNHAISVIKTDVKNGKKLLVIKDSYAHILSQFLINDYEEIHFLDLRYYNMPASSYIKENNIENVLLLYNVTNFISDIAIKNIR